MRNTILTSLFLASATLASASRFECLHTRSLELAVAASCGDEGSLNNCLSHIPLSTQADALPQELARCFVDAGCTTAESLIEASRVLATCDGLSSDLRRVARNPLPLVTAMLPRQTTAATPTAATITSNNDTPASPSPCFTDSTTEITTCPVQSTGASSGKKLPCYQTVTTTPKCRDGLICKSDVQGNPSCMYKHSSLPIEGTIIAIVFAGAIALSVIAVCVFCCRERREHKRIERAAEAARIAKEAKTQATVAAKRPGVSVTGGVGGGPAVEGQPLMYQGGAGAGGGAGSGVDAGQQHGGQGQYQSQGYGGAGNPFSDADAQHPLR